MPPRTCAECQRLWREYSRATIQHVQSEEKLKVAALAERSDAIRGLTLTVEAAARVRELAREAIEHHEKTRQTGAAGG